MKLNLHLNSIYKLHRFYKSFFFELKLEGSMVNEHGSDVTLLADNGKSPFRRQVLNVFLPMTAHLRRAGSIATSYLQYLLVYFIKLLCDNSYVFYSFYLYSYICICLFLICIFQYMLQWIFAFDNLFWYMRHLFIYLLLCSFLLSCSFVLFARGVENDFSWHLPGRCKKRNQDNQETIRT